jgi:hypothetical protein
MTILHKLGDFDTGADLNLKMASSVESLKTLLRHCSSLFVPSPTPWRRSSSTGRRLSSLSTVERTLNVLRAIERILKCAPCLFFFFFSFLICSQRLDYVLIHLHGGGKPLWPEGGKTTVWWLSGKVYLHLQEPAQLAHIPASQARPHHLSHWYSDMLDMSDTVCGRSRPSPHSSTKSGKHSSTTASRLTHACHCCRSSQVRSDRDTAAASNLLRECMKLERTYVHPIFYGLALEIAQLKTKEKGAAAISAFQREGEPPMLSPQELETIF